MKAKIDNSKFNLLYLGKDGKLYNNNMVSIDHLPFGKEYELYSHVQLKAIKYNIHLIYKQMSIIKNLKKWGNMPESINKNTIQFYSVYHKKLEIPKNVISYYEYPQKNVSFYEINNKYYDEDLNPIKDQTYYINKNKFDVRTIILLTYQ